MTTKDSANLSATGLINLFVVYLIWGSTYLAIRVGVRDGSGFEPFMLAGMRVFTAGLLMLGYAAIKKKRIRLTRQEFLRLFLYGVLFWLGGNGLVSLGEQRVPSGLAALFIGAVPIWTTILDAVIDRRRPTTLLLLSLLMGFFGIFVLSLPTLNSGVSADLISVGLLIIAAISWGTGSVMQSRKRMDLDLMVNSGYQQLFGGILLFTAAGIKGEPIPAPIFEAWVAWAYLVVFGSIIAYSSFIKALELLPTNIVMTYAYVNPIIAVVLGWMILGEGITIYTVGGALLVIIGIMGVFRFRNDVPKQASSA
ncbi:MAG: EamA family transporter [Anaerolineae bacterium]|nr:EamA family transporter [Anaerolineae bacterium]